MKKILVLLMLLLCLGACENKENQSTSADIRYFDMIELVSSYTNFLTSSNYFDVSAEMSKIEDGYRYYVFIDNPRIAMYDIEAVAIEKGVDYRLIMAANVGVFEEQEYHMIPNQSNIDKGYVKGLSISGISANEKTDLYVMVQWKSEDRSTSYREFYRVTAEYGEESHDN